MNAASILRKASKKTEKEEKDKVPMTDKEISKLIEMVKERQTKPDDEAVEIGYQTVEQKLRDTSFSRMEKKYTKT